MTESEIFNALFGGGNHSLPFLLKFTHPDAGTVRVTNNNENITYNNETFYAADFTYTPPESKGSGGVLDISSEPNENDLFEFVENADYRYRLDVVGAILEDGTIQPIKSYKHFYGSVTADKSGRLNFQLGADDRKDMTFTPYVFDTDNNPGNA